VVVSLANPKAAGSLSQVPVQVTITTGSVSNVLIVPVDALLAQPGGGYAVEVTGPGGHHLVKVTPGLFDDAAGTVQVTGHLTPGQHVVVPGI
jgi:multidrug efflux pump subunit AcrA (membrane-fusion protein)